MAADITTRGGPRAGAARRGPQVDILVNNAGGPPPGDFRKFTRDDWIAALDANMLTPIELIKATVDAMIERRFGRIVNITSSAVKAPIDILGLSNGARSGLTGFVAGLARTDGLAANVTINNLLPGPLHTDRLRGNFAARRRKKKGISVEEARGGARARPFPRSASATRWSSASTARCCAASRPPTSPARTC